MPPPPIPLEHKLAAGLPNRPAEGCWEWARGRSEAGYGDLSHRQRHQHAHRVAWELVNGPVPPGMSVLHGCDNPPCCRPDHLFLGTQRDNVRDMFAKRRGNPYGARGSHPTRKLTPEKVRAIRARLGSTTYAALGREFGVRYQTIAAIDKGEIWRGV